MKRKGTAIAASKPQTGVRPEHGMHEGVLYVDESQIRSRHDIDKLRGLTPTSIVVRPAAEPLIKELSDYLYNDVLAPMDVSPPPKASNAGAVSGPTKDDGAQAASGNDERQGFIDAAAVAMHARGVPLVAVWRKATELWESRVEWLKHQNGG